MPDKRETLQDGITKVTSERTGRVSYEARWTWEDASGQRRYGRERFDTLKAAKTHRAKMIASIAAGGHEAAPRMTVGEYYEQWVARKQHEWTTGTAYTRAWQWRKYIAPELAGIKLVSVTKPKCQQIVNDLAAQHKPAMVRNVYALLASILKGAMLDGYITRNPAVGVDLPRERRPDHEVWTPEQVRDFLASAKDSPYFAIYHLLLTTGMRNGEALALRWDNVDLDRGTVIVRDTMRRMPSGRFEPAQSTKTGKSRLIVLTEGCVQTLRQHKRKQDAMRAEADRWDDRGYVFTRPDGRYLNQVAVSNRLKLDIEQAEITPVLTLHGFRHTVATMLMMEGVQDRAIQDLLGHSTVSTTMNMYAHVTERLRRTTSERVSALLEATPDATTSPMKRGSESG